MGLNVKALGSGILGGYGKVAGSKAQGFVAGLTENAVAQKAAKVVGEGVTNAAIGAVGGTVTGAMVGGIAGAIDENSTVGQGMKEGIGNGFLLGGLAGGVGITGFNHKEKLINIAKDSNIAKKVSERKANDGGPIVGDAMEDIVENMVT